LREIGPPARRLRHQLLCITRDAESDRRRRACFLRLQRLNRRLHRATHVIEAAHAGLLRLESRHACSLRLQGGRQEGVDATSSLRIEAMHCTKLKARRLCLHWRKLVLSLGICERTLYRHTGHHWLHLLHKLATRLLHAGAETHDPRSRLLLGDRIRVHLLLGYLLLHGILLLQTRLINIVQALAWWCDLRLKCLRGHASHLRH